MTEYKKVPTDTRAEHAKDPLANVARAGVAAMIGKPGSDIQAMERRGQQELLDSHVLPTDLNRFTREQFEALGFVFGDLLPADPIFRVAKLPDGWRRVAADHAMWIHIVDERGIARVNVFYKAAYYDRNAHMSIVDVGGEMASRVIYGEHPLTEDQLAIVDQFTDAELAVFTRELRQRAEELARADTLSKSDEMTIRNIESATAILRAREARRRGE